jgi:hypothetical protein
MGPLRLPLTPLESAHVEQLKKAMTNYGLTLSKPARRPTRMGFRKLL